MTRIQYVGYEPQPNIRTYTFRVLGVSVEAREFTMSIKTEALLNSQFKYQDIPDLCFAKLKNDLTFETQEHPLPLRMTVSDIELRKYVEEHYPAKRKPLKTW